MMTAHRLLLLAVLILPASQAAAQTLPWPTDPAPWRFGGEGGMRPCTEFAKLREDVQKLRLAAKAVGQRKASRQEICTHIAAYSAAELKWVKYTEASVQSCGITAELLEKLKQVHANTEQTKERICAAADGLRLDVPSPERSPGGYMLD